MIHPKLEKLLTQYGENTVNNKTYFTYISFKKMKSGKVIIKDLDTKLENNTKAALYQLAIDLNLHKISNDSKTQLLQKINKLIS